MIRLEADDDLPFRLRDARPDIVFNIAEGLAGPNREAHVPALCEFWGMPCTGSDSMTLAICLDKGRTKEILAHHGIPTAPFTVASAPAELDGFVAWPAMVKPLHEGSSKGITAASFCRSRREVAAGHRHRGRPLSAARARRALPARPGVHLRDPGQRQPPRRMLPIVEIDFAALPPGAPPIYSYEAKWVWDSRGDAPRHLPLPGRWWIPASRPPSSGTALAAYRVLRCRDWARIDLRCDEHGVPHVLEINPLPGIHPDPAMNSCLPNAARAAGLDYAEHDPRRPASCRGPPWSCPLARAPRRRVAVVVDAVAETAELYESAVAELARRRARGPPERWASSPWSWSSTASLVVARRSSGRELRPGLQPLRGPRRTGLGGAPRGRGGRAPRPAPDRRPRLHPGPLPSQGPGQRAPARARHRRPRLGGGRGGRSRSPGVRFPAIVKPAAEDASLGIDDHSVVHDAAELAAALERGHRTWDRLLVQRYVEGREFNLAVVGDQVLPPSEILWALPDGPPPHRFVCRASGRRAASTTAGRRRDGSGPRKGGSLRRLHRLATRVWAAVDGAGYGRIDVRMDGRGRLYVIEVNPNPDLSPDAGLARQASAAGWSYPELIARIAELAFTTRGPAGPRARRPPASAAPRGRQVTRKATEAGMPEETLKARGPIHRRELRIAPDLFEARFASGCATRRCEGRCCRGGVWLDPGERDAILAHADLVREAMDPGQPRDTRRWFSRRVNEDPDFPSGRAVHTRKREGALRLPERRRPLRPPEGLLGRSRRPEAQAVLLHRVSR